MDLNSLRDERKKWLTWKNIAPFQDAIRSLKTYENVEVTLGDRVEVQIKDLSRQDAQQIKETALLMKPWRKGPFQINDLFIDSEWQSQIKYNLLEPHFNLKDKVVGDIGCNNGYYLFRMLSQEPKKLIGFDPSAIYYSQFQFINHFIKSDIVYELLGVEHVEFYEHKFDTLFCLGVLYHRSDPIAMLKSLFKGLNKGGELILDTFMIDGEGEMCLTPRDRYSKIPNIYFVPTVNALKNWCFRAGFETVEVLEIMKTEPTEQRKTEWIETQSLEDFLDPDDQTKTVEGYPAPKRVYIKAMKSL
ncbi:MULTISPECIES: tRNA 5-methoxyuridine(34)/uridine 5-oxyacetic acid(34) synthase CmoB [Sulfurovum]|uniref:tRNA 5-methoxyuridine(34)/uridine 5-oxyacetic acid(34) synthase CmoB n=1 Tax=Sulfurovum xiamenensis TaxID=3019066 RepID=A0ABT7QTN8_9BACT|nr:MULTISPECIES: tRNA 5-methoxyuridine(34)/uridine 5-oxyacetic acid(34) synthase CmoB [Sulfurovum]EIF51889.1 tRNA mo(5)U34 methyltransferase [Sulfurovum sp. AR]MDM5264299.1 tRNA 5-methoxyuridine(34)/uridine 5-oxyacetic acid(34) synthase CmoB [Sulfurovum xiamenensis]